MEYIVSDAEFFHDFLIEQKLKTTRSLPENNSIPHIEYNQNDNISSISMPIDLKEMELLYPPEENVTSTDSSNLVNYFEYNNTNFGSIVDYKIQNTSFNEDQILISMQSSSYDKEELQQDSAETNTLNELLPDYKLLKAYKEKAKSINDLEELFKLTREMIDIGVSIETNQNSNIVNCDRLKNKFFCEIRKYLRYLAINGHLDANYLLADAFSSGIFGSINDKEAFKAFKHAAKRGHVESAYRTAFCYETGRGVNKSASKAIDYLRYGASKNHPSSMYKLGMCYYHCKLGVPNNIKLKITGVSWLTRAVENSTEMLCQAPYELAKVYESGYRDIVIPDQRYAVELYVKAASLGHTISASILGQLYEKGSELIPRDLNLAVLYCEQAAVGSDPAAMYTYGCFYLVGVTGILRIDLRCGFNWIFKAAKCELSKAQYLLGYLYEKGIGCQQNNEFCWIWYRKAAENDYEPAMVKIGKNIKQTSFFSKAFKFKRMFF